MASGITSKVEKWKKWKSGRSRKVEKWKKWKSELKS
jgi:hypothetical protein